MRRAYKTFEFNLSFTFFEEMLEEYLKHNVIKII